MGLKVGAAVPPFFGEDGSPSNKMLHAWVEAHLRTKHLDLSNRLATTDVG